MSAEWWYAALGIKVENKGGEKQFLATALRFSPPLFPPPFVRKRAPFRERSDAESPSRNSLTDRLNTNLTPNNCKKAPPPQDSPREMRLST